MCDDFNQSRSTSKYPADSGHLKKTQLPPHVLLDCIQTQIWFLTDEVHYGFVNKAHSRFIGLEKSRIEGRSLYNFFSPEEAETCIKSNRVVFENQSFVISEEWMKDRTGQNRLLKICKTPVHDPETGKTCVVCSAEDITEQRQLDEMRGEFLSTAAHELRSPLTSIMGFAELVMARPDLSGEKRNRYNAHILAQSKILESIIANYLNVSQIESGRDLPFNPGPVCIKTLITEVVQQFTDQKTDREFVCSIGNAPELQLDRVKMIQVMYNLLSNAVKYSKQGSRVMVHGQCQKSGQYHITVSDNGCGMTKQEQEHVFNKYFRGTRARHQCKGLGLGMAVVKYMVDLHQGQTWLESEPGKGTTVHVLLPCGNSSSCFLSSA
ncbi:PAS domain S-box-containing protein [Desulfosalsimonas propionicica]|uniref:histidine kinase n=1 Tax=Desulfosalsimonas propionicica TaxID=332175 RepID=A0A7W0HKP7_9BACT|nr:PAS domain-containing sensor histidine kinase [Desulfosalsimonas propionicica]MBA2881450.1 PAS domain S-box-containing protein [Desulfosalsimonas propionicica]